jgi:hypothetical protein
VGSEVSGFTDKQKEKTKMKKMMLVMAMMLVAGISQAATVTWSTGAIKTPTLPNGVFGANAGSTTGIYLAIVSFYEDVGGAQGALIAAVTGNTDNSTGATSLLNGTTTAGYSFTAGTKYWASVYVSTTPGLLGAGDGGYWKMQSAAGQFTAVTPASVSINFLTGSNIGGANLMPTQWTLVPEPTSMALLALGAAVLGLRRRNRK